MEQPITVSLPNEIALALEQATRDEGISSSELVGKALRQYIALRKYRLLRDRLSPRAEAQGIVCDQDVFDRVS
jgi:metal-responsive CopG/Arc/MetJ family transcriptional regulator